MTEMLGSDAQRGEKRRRELLAVLVATMQLFSLHIHSTDTLESLEAARRGQVKRYEGTDACCIGTQIVKENSHLYKPASQTLHLLEHFFLRSNTG